MIACFKRHGGIILIVITGFLLRLLAAMADPFLHPWDERFHALVARNLMDNPIVPMLRAHPITENYDQFMWCCNHIWLHKQPLFMWQMALSMKLFDVSILSMRLPSVVMGSLLILILYRIAILLTSNKRIALLSAALLCFSNFHLQMISGVKGMDHNDVAHGFYVLAGIWAYAEYIKSGKWRWVVIIGLFSGAAVLNKWLTGLLVYLAWGISFVLRIKNREDWFKEVPKMLVSVLICIVVFLPWQIYILNTFPDLARYEYEFNRRHITEALEGHEGTVFFYLEQLRDLMGYLYLLVPVGILIAWKSIKIQRALNLAITVSVLFVFLFFSLLVKTKVDTYLFMVVPLMFIYVAIVLDFVLSKFRFIRKVKVPILVLTIWLTLNPIAIINYLSPTNSERNDRIYNAQIYRDLKKYIPHDVKVVMNMNSFEDIDVMFFNNDLTAYHWTLSEEDFEGFAREKIPIAVFEPHGNYNLPEYVLRYPYLYIIRKQLRSF